MLFTSRDGHRSRGHSHHPSCHPWGSADGRKARGRGRSCKDRRRNRRHHAEAGPAERRSGRRHSGAAEGSRQSGEGHHGEAGGRSGPREGRRSSEGAGSDDGSRHGEGCNREEVRGGHSSRPWAGHGHSRIRGHDSQGNESGSEAREDAGSLIEAARV